ncbi:hypothetical protein Z946_2992 [Sulfitobacter noctilucicola]|uniref:Phytanoyl-CoA dioxygenase n=1 Tax=Sulfitobacter noctilucicola TaxID=1342301 RepID=A0A7W6MAI5_9RHOB|nr:hypothetical protein [Sulfitobacter noctilucicola]KIN64105.1 hypothetical protein Z946_2992 [Sulfitobacter noctilucicola]MBB4175459.1 hypothetical protein [Sulfitobacter noctilucicola]
MTAADGFTVFEATEPALNWAKSAHRTALKVASDPQVRLANLRHGETWFVGVDALPNAQDGSIDGTPLDGAWRDTVNWQGEWHRAQLSVVYPGYPERDTGETDGTHRYRVKRHAAHVDGLLPLGPDRQRFLQEPHAFILGLPLNVSDGSPLVVWPGSQRIMGDALRKAIGDARPQDIDLTEPYQSARRLVFERITPQRIIAAPGQAVLLHRHLLHGVAPWEASANAPPEGRMIGYFRPQFSLAEWCREA